MSKMIEWMAKKVNSNVPEKHRQNFLQALKHNRAYVEEVTSLDVEGLSMFYTMEVDEVVSMSTAEGDPNVYVTCARRIVDYLCDELLKEELDKTE
jgi:hypothetical protein